MAMMITKFHRLIGSKIFWGLFITIISILFVFTFIPNTDGMNPFGIGKPKNDAGILNGKPVSYPEYSSTQRNVSAINNLFNQRLTDRELEDRTWQRIASHQMASKLGMRISANDLQNSIAQNFSGPQGYSPQAYGNFINQQFGGQTNAFEALWADFLVESQLRNVAADQFLLAPSEIKELYHQVKDQFTVEYTILERDQAGEVSVSDAELASYYEDHKDEFKTPEERSASYVAIAASNYVAAAQAEITDEQIQTYYDLNIGQFTVTDMVTKVQAAVTPTNALATATNALATATNALATATNALATATNALATATNALTTATNAVQATTNLVEEIGEIRIIPIDEARPAIMARLAGEGSRKKAAFQADGLFALTIPRGGQAPKDLAELAQADNLKLSTTGYIRVGAIVPDVEMAVFFEFSQAIFELSNAQGENISDPIVGSNYVYILRLDEVKAPEIPSLEEVKESMYIQAEKFYIGQALTEKAKALRDDIAKGLATNSFSAVCSNLTLSVTSAPPYTIYSETPVELNNNQRLIMDSIGDYQQGEVTEVINAGENAIIAYLKERKTADALDYDTLAPEIQGELLRRRVDGVFKDFGTYLLDKAGLESKIVYDQPDDANAEDS
jgi:hypothetical protein